MKKLKIALEGGINGLSDDECSTWRDTVINKLGHKFYFHNPMDFDCRGRELELEVDLVEFDEAGIESSQIILVNASTAGWGTAMAVQMAYDQGKYIITIYESDKPISPWLNNRSTRVLRRFIDAVDFLMHISEKELENIYI